MATHTTDLWRFIKSHKATEAASLKVLQRFVLSLNKQELTHLISIYLKSKLSQNGCIKPTYKQAEKVLLNGNSDDCLGNVDEQILTKMNRKYGNKYNKKIATRIQQRQQHNKLNLFSIPSEVAAYSFQYLPFSELCKIQRVSSYFMYLHHQYPGLCHYFLNMNKKFCLRAMRNMFDLSKLRDFKHITIRHAEYKHGYYNVAHTRRRAMLFRHILHEIISQSPNIQTLTILVHGSIYRTLPKEPFNTLRLIMQIFKHLPISTLIWQTDVFCSTNWYSVSDILNGIRAMGINKIFPRLKRFDCGLSTHYLMEMMNPFIDGVIYPYILRYDALESLSISCDSVDMFDRNTDLIGLILGNMNNLQSLSLASLIPDKIITIDENVKSTNLNELNMTFRSITNRHNRNVSVSTAIHSVLNQLFSCFVGITKFKLGFKRMENTQIESFHFFDCFSILFEKKRLYSMINAPVAPLEFLVFDEMPVINCRQFLSGFSESNCQSVLNLRHFGIKLEQNDYRELNLLIDDYIVPFIKDSNLESIDISCDYFYFNQSDVTSHLNALYNVIANLPKSIVSLNVALPNYCLAVPDLDVNSSENIAKKLCEMLTERTTSSKLETIRFNNAKLSSECRRFLTFMFGFNQKISGETRFGQYHLTFI